MTDAAPALIAWLGEAGARAEALGGKGASLDRLTAMGFDVPPGFCITTEAFRRQVAGLRLRGAAGAANLASAPLLPELASELALAVDRLATTLPGTASIFAVRSSAIGEDGSTASYAGLHDTELGVTPPEVAAAVRRCWASLWSAPAVAYRTRRGLPDDDVAMAVVVQALVPADAAAVAFTRHPVTGREDQLVLTAVRGLGDEMVSGTVTPDTWVIDRASRSVAEFEPGDGEDEPALDEASLAGLVELCLAVESRLGTAVDIEAALAGGRWFLLQARPITTGANAGAGAGAGSGAGAGAGAAVGGPA